MYKKLIEFHKAGKLSFKYVKTFNMDEYVGECFRPGLLRELNQFHHATTLNTMSCFVLLFPSLRLAKKSP